MKVKKYLIIMGIVTVLVLAGAFAASAVSGAAFTTYNPWVDGAFKDVCKNSRIDCNIYGAKPDVWLNGGPTANGLGPDGLYFFAVLVPGGQPDPNDGGAKNLSDDYDFYTDRTFTVTDGEVSEYTGTTHDLDSGDTLDPERDYCRFKRGCAPDGNPPLIRLYPYADTWNPGGVYILAICSLDRGYPVEPRDCKYDAFKVKEEQLTASLFLWGMKFEDMEANGSKDLIDGGLSDWDIHIYGTGFLGESIDVIVTTGAGGYWEYQKDYTYNKFTPLVDALLTVCELPQEGWTQSFPDPACYELIIPPAAMAEVPDLDFGNFEPVSVNAYKFFDRDLDGFFDEGEGLVEGFEFCLYDSMDNLVSDDDFVSFPQNACQLTNEDGLVTWIELIPGIYTVKEGDNPDYWHPTTAIEDTLTLFSGGSDEVYVGNVVNCIGLTPGYWVNWRNHYTEEEFTSLLVGTIASSIADADYKLSSLGCDNDDAIHCLQRFILANQLTLNLTSSDLLFKPGEMYPMCELFGYPEITGTIEDWIAGALDAISEGLPRDVILCYKSVLDLFANEYFVFP
jgi:hypothetical protein